MKKVSNIGKVIIVAVLVAIVIIVIIVYSGQHGPSSTAFNGSSSTDATVIAASPTETTTSGAASSTPTSMSTTKSATNPVVITKSPAAPSIKIITPVLNDTWTIGEQNYISWSKAGNFSGSISLLDATTKQPIGVILPETGPDQTSYTWNTRDVFLNRSDAEKKDVVPGSYIIEVAFDGNNLKPALSPAFSITN